jgi:hypothetical protein
VADLCAAKLRHVSDPFEELHRAWAAFVNELRASHFPAFMVGVWLAVAAAALLSILFR